MYTKGAPFVFVYFFYYYFFFSLSCISFEGGRISFFEVIINVAPYSTLLPEAFKLATCISLEFTYKKG